jgi:hypothetical protein
MYRHCIHCNAALGRNEAVEALPIGRRLAFDPAKGRLWVVCAACARWNLVPFERRWEALEGCERAFRDTRLRRSTDNIGLARVADGTELVRIGAPLRPEFAAWRYGARYAARYARSELLRLGTLTAVTAAALFSGNWLAVMQFAGRLAGRDAEDPIDPGVAFGPAPVRITSPDGHVFRMTRHDLRAVRVRVHDGRVRLALPDPRGRRRPWFEWVGADTLPLLRRMLPAINHGTGATATVTTALQLAESYRTPDAMLARYARADWTPAMYGSDENWADVHRRALLEALPGAGRGTPVVALNASRRLALEMALHEDDERRWLDGELHELERHWREAEAVAAIADRLLLPGAITARAAALRAAAGRSDDADGTDP